MDYALDKWGDRIYPGDYVQCLTDQYFSILMNARARVLSVNGDCIVLKNKHSPTFDSPYRAENFRLSGRYHPFHHNGVDKRRPRKEYLTNSEKGNTAMLHVAMLLPEGHNYESLSSLINSVGGLPKSISDTTLSALKERVKADIRLNPEHRWLMLSGNTIAETSAPPIAFRQW